jgi:dynein heavy chain
MIWSISKFYNKVEPLTGLLRKVSNQIITQCKNKINLREIFDGDVEQSMNHLHESIQCGVAWKKIFDQTKRAVEINSRSKWDFDPSSIFAQIDAFVQRCRDLLEVCEGQVLFARKSAKLPKGQKAPLPVFGGSRGPDIEKSLYEIEDAFEKYIDRLRNLDYDIMDVKATKWHDDYNFYTNGVKDLEGVLCNCALFLFLLEL